MPPETDTLGRCASVADEATRSVPTKFRLYLGFFKIGVCGVRRGRAVGAADDRRRGALADEREYAELLGLGQVLPGPNVGNVSIFIGDRFHGLHRLDAGAWRTDERSAV